MHYWWKVRLYAPSGGYWHAQVRTAEKLEEIDTMQDFYFRLTGCKMLLQGMSEFPYPNTVSLQEAFSGLWQDKTESSQNHDKTKEI